MEVRTVEKRASRQLGPDTKGTGTPLRYLKQKNDIRKIVFENQLERTKLKTRK